MKIDPGHLELQYDVRKGAAANEMNDIHSYI